MDRSDAPPASQFALEHLVGTTLAGRFRVGKLVSQGSTMALFHALDEQSSRAVTLKLIRPRLAAPPSFRERFDDCMRGAAALSHPNVSAVYDWGIAPVGDVSTAYVVVEQLTGGSLRDMFDRGRRLSPSQALAVGLEACRALDYAHRRGYVHTELTPSKLVFGDDRRLRVVDFGLAQLVGERDWERPGSVATHIAWYSAPEQAATGPDAAALDGKADVYALGLVLHEAVTGNLPFKSDSTVATLTARVGRLMPVSADLGPLASVLERAGRPEPHDRYTAAELGKALVQVATKLPRPEPLPLFATSLFEVGEHELRSPDDPTGGVRRPAEPVIVVPLDEPAPLAVSAPPPPPDPPPTPTTPLPADDVPVAVADADVAHADLVILPLDTGIEEAPSVTADPAVDAPGASRAVTATAQIPAVEPAHPSRPRRRFPWKILLALLVVGALVTLGVLATRLFDTTASYVVPNLVRQPEVDARDLVAANGWDVTVENERSDEVSVVGQVVRTVPAAGVELAEDEPFLIVVSAGPLLRELPESTGLVASAAQTALVDLGMVPEVIEAFDETVVPGVVVSWNAPSDPALVAGSQVEPGMAVQLVVSKGPAPRAVPDVQNLPVSDAVAAIEALQLVVHAPSQVFNDVVPAGAIISQDPPPGTEVQRGATVTVVVSLGEDVVAFPDISAAVNFDEARAILEAAGYTAVLTFGDAQGAVRKYTIAGAVPSVGQYFRRGTQVDVEAL